MVAPTDGQKQLVGLINAQHHGVLYIKDKDADNQGLFVKLRVAPLWMDGVLVEREIDTSAVS